MTIKMNKDRQEVRTIKDDVEWISINVYISGDTYRAIKEIANKKGATEYAVTLESFDEYIRRNGITDYERGW